VKLGLKPSTEDDFVYLLVKIPLVSICCKFFV